jgi:hypothetical protein
MFLIKKIGCLFLFVAVHLTCFSQSIPVGTWRTHMPFNRAVSITDDGNKIYCGTLHSLYSFDLSSGEFEKYTKTEGFSGVGISKVNYHLPTQTLVIVYDDANIDLLQQDDVFNLSQIKTASIQGSKQVNSITFRGDSAILSCDFGVVILDVRNKVFKTDVRFSDDVSFANHECLDAAFLNGFFYFATSKGLYKVDATLNLKNLNNWNIVSSLPAGPINAVESFAGKIYANYSGYTLNGNINADTLFTIQQSTIQRYDISNNKVRFDLHAEGDRLCILFNDELKVLNTDESIHFQKTGCFLDGMQVTADQSNNYWVADNKYGAYKINANDCQIFTLDGPFSPYVYDIEIKDNIIWCAAGGLTTGLQNAFRADGIFYNRNNDWKKQAIPDFGYPLPIADMIDVAIDPNDPTHVYAASWGMGLVEVKNYTAVSQLFTDPLDISTAPGYEYKIGGLAFDQDGNLWLSNSHTSAPLKVKKTGNLWSEYNLGAFAPASSMSFKIAIDDRNNTWMSVIGKGIVVRNNKTGQFRLLSNVFNEGDLPSTTVRALCSDLNGEMWVGTDDGIRVFSPSQVFSSANINGQKIVIKAADGNNELLLGETIINDIEADGANRKWIATEGTGVRLVSEDGRDIIYSFTAENSPLLSNNVKCIGINHKTGEVYFGTDLGLVSFRAEATEAGNNFGTVYAFPNPVHPNYQGVITITGMAKDATVKITDVSGNLVYETESLGGQAVWDGKRYDGQRAQTGVYLVFCANKDASETIVTKILFIQ